MGLFNKLRHELIDIIEWPETEPGILVHRFERYENQIKNGAKLIVRAGQKAVFVREGKIADTFNPGTFTLETRNLPVLSTLMGWKYGFDSPFKAEVYFLKVTEQLDRKWGTPNPVMMRDGDFGVVRLRARGNFAYKVGEDADMISRFVGAQSDFRCDDIEGQIRTKLISSFSDCLAELKIPALDLAAKYDEIGSSMQDKLKKDFNSLGLELLSFAIENITVPEEVEKAMDERSSMGAVGNLNNYAQFQAANAMRDAARNSGDGANLMGMMIGGQLAGGMGNILHQEQSSQPASQGGTAGGPPPLPGSEKIFYASLNGQQAGPFGIDEIKTLIAGSKINADTLVWKQGMAGWTKAGEVQELSSLFAAVPPPLPPQ